MATIDRRTFLSTGARAGACLCCLCALPGSPPPALASDAADTAPIVPAELNYCGYSCPSDCAFLQGTLEDDVELKKKAWKLWEIEERFGVAFDADQAVCRGCKAAREPEGIVLSRCTVRSCAVDKDLDCCVECSELEGCGKDLWTRFPQFKQQVIEMQQRYRAQT